MVPGRILFVDDDKKTLEAFKRLLHGIFDVETAEGGAQALAAIQMLGPFHVVIADMQMPGMNGVELLARVRRLAPKSVRMVLTGHKEIDSAIEAVNEGRIFRYLTKPCVKEELINSIHLALEQYRAIGAVKKLVQDAQEIKAHAAAFSKVLESHPLK